MKDYQNGVSVTYAHLVAVLATRLPVGDKPIKMLDAGCGMGEFMRVAHAALAPGRPRLEMYGFDVVDHGVQMSDFLHAAIERLSASHPEVDWRERVREGSAHEPWPYRDAMFDVVVTNQVLEHVSDLEMFLSELKRVMAPGGFSLHLFPLSHVLHEWHLGIPLAHKIRSHTMRRWYVSRLSRWGLGVYDRSIDVRDFSEAHADYIAAWTHYRSWRDVYILASGLGLRVDHSLTYDLYRRRLIRAGVWAPRLGKGCHEHPVLRTTFFHVAKFASSVCIEIARADAYDASWSCDKKFP